FNGWSPGNSRFIFKNNQLNFDVPSGVIEFKLTKGSWEKVETTEKGEAIANRSINIKKDTVVHLNVGGWQNVFEKNKPVSSASKNVHLLDTSFYIPQLKRHRRIWIYLPKNYKKETSTKFPVLYMQDGQNLFDVATAFAGEWGVDEFMDTARVKKSIVVGIDNGGSYRMTEYNPYNHDRFGKGEGKEYVDFMANILKPFIDKNVRTLSDAKNTIVAGSSMGGLISMYAAMNYPEVFGKAGIFSPAFWVAGTEFFSDLRKKAKKINGDIYLYGGGLEGKEMVPDMQRTAKILAKYSKAKIKTKIKKTGKHNEAEWQLQFPMFYRWVIK
ncbi:MAG: alpha/beta hydrolase, partial [Niabella sp.]